MNPFSDSSRSSGSGRAPLALATLVVTLAAAATPAMSASATAPPPGTAAPARASSAAPERLTGTVRSVDLRAETLDLVSGVGLSLRVRRVHLPAPLRVKGAAPESAAVVLAPGCIVRVECSSTPAGSVASTVELLRAAPRGVKP